MQTRLILLDADGVLWRGGEVIPEAPGFIRRAQAAGLRCVLISNNAGPDRAAYLMKCRRMELDFAAEDIYSTNYLSGLYLAKHHPGARVLVAGSQMLVASVAQYVDAVDVHLWLEQQGIGGWLDTPEQLVALDDIDFDVVLVGIDINISYAALAALGVAVQRGAKLVAANDDLSFPFQRGMTLPGNGSFVAMVAALGEAEVTRLGKPEPYLLELIAEETGIAPPAMLMVGDRMETDIVMAQRAGMPAALVLTGVTSADDAPAPHSGLLVAPTLDDVAQALGI